MKAAIAAVVLFSVCAGAANTQTWLSTVDPYSAPRNPDANAIMQLFEPDAKWGAPDVNVFKASTQFLLRSKDEELKSMLGGLARRRVALGVEGLILVYRDNCGRGVEGYESRNAIPYMITRVQRAGGALKYVAMDEPIWMGHHATGERFCQDSIENIAEQLAPNVRAIAAAFPQAQIGDIEPLAMDASVLLQFAKAFQATSGEPLAFVHADINWRSSWQQRLAEWKTALHGAGIRLGVICNGDDRRGDLAWTASAISNCQEVLQDTRTRPDDVIVQSWGRAPKKMLPVDEPDTLTNAAARINRLLQQK
jgi:hypothetical protein